MQRLHLDAAVDDRLGDAELAVEFQRAGLHDHGAGGFPGPGGPVDDAGPDAALEQGEGEHQAGRAGAGDEDLGARRIRVGHGASFRGADPWQHNRPGRRAFAMGPAGAIRARSSAPPAVPAKAGSG